MLRHGEPRRCGACGHLGVSQRPQQRGACSDHGRSWYPPTPREATTVSSTALPLVNCDWGCVGLTWLGWRAFDHLLASSCPLGC
eukprot:159370-Chlamydomonas_euryale.AAC.1